MEKKIYSAPVTKEIQISAMPLMQTSVKGAGAADDIGWGGEGTGQSADSRGGGWDDED